MTALALAAAGPDPAPDSGSGLLTVRETTAVSGLPGRDRVPADHPGRPGRRPARHPTRTRPHRKGPLPAMTPTPDPRAPRPCCRRPAPAAPPPAPARAAGHIPQDTATGGQPGNSDKPPASEPARPGPVPPAGRARPARPRDAALAALTVVTPVSPADRLLTPAEVGEMLRVAPSTVTGWAQAGKLASFRTPGGHRRYSETEVRGFLNGWQHVSVPPATD